MDPSSLSLTITSEVWFANVAASQEAKRTNLDGAAAYSQS